MSCLKQLSTSGGTASSSAVVPIITQGHPVSPDVDFRYSSESSRTLTIGGTRPVAVDSDFRERPSTWLSRNIDGAHDFAFSSCALMVPSVRAAVSPMIS